VLAASPRVRPPCPRYREGRDSSRDNSASGGRDGLPFNCAGINHLIRREQADMTDLPCPGGPVNEAPLHVDSFGLLGWDWKFWGDKTRMIFPSSRSQGPCDEFHS
jgi:hypothetical protein